MRYFGAFFSLMVALPLSTLAQDKIGGESNNKAPLAPMPQVVRTPPDNLSTQEKVSLGKQLFFDPRLSGDNTMSCATCHVAEQAFGDGLALGKGHAGKTLTRNTQTCWNVAFLSSFFWDGRAATLEEQALAPMLSTDEMNQDLNRLEEELNAIPGYVRQFEIVFASKPNREGIAKALAAYQRSLVTGLSPFDRYLLGDKHALSDDAKRGLELFQGEAKCVECHNGPMLSDGKYYRLGVSTRDEGRGKVTGKRDDRFRFRTPSLRNVAETGPYMHDGSLKTLNDVVTFYFRGIPSTSPDGLTPDLNVLDGQSFSDIPYLIAFLDSLTGAAPDSKPPRLP